MLRRASRIVPLLVLASCATTQQTARNKPDLGPVLPLNSVRLYETGIGYFERGGQLAAHASVNLPVPTGHLDDALKTLVVYGDDGKPAIENLEFPSRVSPGMARALAGLSTEDNNPVDYEQVLISMKGADLELRVGKETLRGRIVDLAGEVGARNVVVMTDEGALRNLVVKQITSIRPTTAQIRTRLDSSLSALSQRGSDWHRSIRLRASSSAQLRIGYIAEAPVWRATYRFVTASDHKGGQLQGWALVHNDTDENWSGVRVHLASGKPDSFLVPLAAPRYARRELRTPDEELSTIPQLLEGTADGMWNDGESTIGLGTLGGTGHGSGGGGVGYGRGRGSIGKPRPASSSALSVGNLHRDAGVEGVEGSTLFNYAIASPLDLSAHSSALVSFVDAKPRAEEITWFASDSASARRALRLENTTAQTLPEGPIALFSEGSFIGESKLAQTKPGQRRFVDFADDLDITLTMPLDDKRATIKQVDFVRGALLVHKIVERTQRYHLENRGASARTVFVGFEAVTNAKVEGVDRLDFHGESLDESSPVAVFQIAARARADRTVHITEGMQLPIAAEDLKREDLEELITATNLPAPVRARLAQARPFVAALADQDAATERLEDEEKTIQKDLERLQKHLASLGNSKEAAQPLVARVLEHERRLEAIEKQQSKLTDAHTASTRALSALFEKP